MTISEQREEVTTVLPLPANRPKPPKPSRNPKPPKPPRPPRGARPTQPPKPPRRIPKPAVQLAPLSPAQALVRSIVALAAALLLMFGANLLILSHIQHFASQQQLMNSYREQLSAGTAPVSEGDFNDVLLSDGAPVGVLSISRLGIREVIVEGTSSGVLAAGPGHRRDTVLPGQAGVSVIMGRAAAYGGPFGGIQQLQPGEKVEVRTGQGVQKFEVLGLRYAGDPTPPAPKRGEARMILQTARGAAYVPAGIAYVDARLVGTAQPAGTRQTSSVVLPLRDKALATDPTTAWALVFALQFLLIAEVLAVWSFRRLGAQKTWVVFVPVLLLAGIFVADQVTRLLPNLM